MEAGDGLAVGECPAEHRAWVEGLRRGGHNQLISTHETLPNSWACPPGHLFSVRGPDYLRTKAKAAAGKWLLQPLAFDLLQGGPSQLAHIMAHPHCRVRAALDVANIASSCFSDQKRLPFVWAFNLLIGSKSHHSFVFYFVTFQSPPAGSLLQRFLDGDDAFRNSRLKLLTRFPEAPRLLQVVVGDRWAVCLPGKYVKCTYTRGKNYMEVDMDLGSHMLTRTAATLGFRLGPTAVADMAFALEGVSEEELPESILGAVRLMKLEPSSAPLLMADINGQPEGEVGNTFNLQKQLPDINFMAEGADEGAAAPLRRVRSQPSPWEDQLQNDR